MGIVRCVKASQQGIPPTADWPSCVGIVRPTKWPVQSGVRLSKTRTRGNTRAKNRCSFLFVSPTSPSKNSNFFGLRENPGKKTPFYLLLASRSRLDNQKDAVSILISRDGPTCQKRHRFRPISTVGHIYLDNQRRCRTQARLFILSPVRTV